MLEGTMSAPAHRAGSAEAGRAGAAHEPPRRDLLARLSAMSLANPPHRPNGRPGAETEATAVARAWLDLIHSGRSASSWAVAAPALRQTIGAEEWLAALRSLGVELGRCRSRRLQDQTTFEAFPGVPAGPYTIIHFESRFEERPSVIETVTTCLGDDGHWRVAAYVVR